MTWYRLDVGTATAPRMQRLAHAMGCPLDQAVGRWLMLVDFVVSEAPDAATADLDPRDLAVAMRWEGPPEGLLCLLQEVGIIDPNGVLAGAERLTAGHRDAERKRMEREAKKLNNHGAPSRTSADASGTVPDNPASRARADRPTDRPTERRSDSSELAENGHSKPVPLALVPIDPQPRAIVTFPCVGPVKHWILTESIAQELAEAFPTVDVVGEAKKAKAWIEAHESNRKTARGYRAFVTRWLTKATDKPSPPTRQPPPRPYRGIDLSAAGGEE